MELVVTRLHLDLDACGAYERGCLCFIASHGGYFSNPDIYIISQWDFLTRYWANKSSFPFNWDRALFSRFNSVCSALNTHRTQTCHTHTHACKCTHAHELLEAHLISFVMIVRYRCPWHREQAAIEPTPNPRWSSCRKEECRQHCLPCWRQSFLQQQSS